MSGGWGDVFVMQSQGRTEIHHPTEVNNHTDKAGQGGQHRRQGWDVGELLLEQNYTT